MQLLILSINIVFFIRNALGEEQYLCSALEVKKFAI